jgi:hypothetical protein
VALEATVPERPQNPAAALGTALHEAAEEALTKGWPAAKLAGNTYNGIVVNEEDLKDRVQSFVDNVNAWIQSPDYSEHGLECQVTIADDCWGTADAVVVMQEELIVNDLKTGTGVTVWAKDNPQLLIYALGSYYDWKDWHTFKTVRLVIDQSAKGHYDEQVITVDELLEFETKVLECIGNIKRLNEGKSIPVEKYNPGPKQCQWCDARGVCPALKAKVDEETAKDFELMANAELGEALQSVPMIKAWIKGVEDRAKMTMLENEEHVPGFKVVKGKRSRGWIDPDAALAYLRPRVKAFVSNCYVSKPMTMPQIEKVLKDKSLHKVNNLDISNLFEWREGSPTIAVDDDPRQAIMPGERAADDFAEFAES